MPAKLPPGQRHIKSRTLEEALSGVKPNTNIFHNNTGERVINPRTGRLCAPGKPRKRPYKPLSEKAYLNNYLLRANPEHPRYCPEIARRVFESNSKAGKNGAAKRRSTPKGYRYEEWQEIFKGRMDKARTIVDDLIDRGVVNLPARINEDTGEVAEFVPGFDDVATVRDTTTDAGKAVAALDYATAVFISPEMSLENRYKHAQLVLAYTKQKPVEKKAIAVDTPEAWLAALTADEI